MSKIKIDVEEIRDLIVGFEKLVDRREEHNDRLKDMMYKLENVKSKGFVEEIVEKLEAHIHDVDMVQVENLKYPVDFLNNLADNFEEVDERLFKEQK